MKTKIKWEEKRKRQNCSSNAMKSLFDSFAVIRFLSHSFIAFQFIIQCFLLLFLFFFFVLLFSLHAFVCCWLFVNCYCLYMYNNIDFASFRFKKIKMKNNIKLYNNTTYKRLSIFNSHNNNNNETKIYVRISLFTKQKKKKKKKLKQSILCDRVKAKLSYTKQCKAKSEVFFIFGRYLGRYMKTKREN